MLGFGILRFRVLGFWVLGSRGLCGYIGGYIRVPLGFERGYIGIMEKKMETTI